MTEPIAYLNGETVSISEAKLSVFDLGIMQAATVTEMIRTFGLRPYRLDDHLDRLFRSIDAVGFSMQLDRSDLRQVVEDIVSHNAKLIDPRLDLGVSVFVTAGTSPIAPEGIAHEGLTVCVHTYLLPFRHWADLYETGQQLVVPRIRHIPPESLDPRIKTRSRLHWYLADRQAKLIDASSRAVLLDQYGHITETSTGNFFAVIDGCILTPSEKTTLGGVSQMVINELAAELNIECDDADLRADDTIIATELFTTSTPYCILPVTRFNGHSINGGVPGPVYLQVLSAWKEAVGVDIMEQMRIGARLA